MSLDSSKVIVPGHGRIWIGPVDSLGPGQLLKITGSPTQAVITTTVNAVPSAAVTLKSTDTVAAKMTLLANALAANTAVGAGNVVIVPGPDAWSFLIILDPLVTVPAITAAGTFTGGTTPAVAVSTTTVGRAADFTAWSEIGHTSNDSPLQVNRSGGDVTSVGSWQQDNIDSSTAPVTEALAYSLLQYDQQAMKHYYGANAQLGLDGTLQADKSGATPIEEALFLIIRNGAKAQVRHWPRVSTGPADGENFDTSKLAEMPVQSNILSSNTLSYGKSISPVGVAA